MVPFLGHHVYFFRLEYFEKNFTADYLGFLLPADHNIMDLLQREHPKMDDTMFLENFL